MNKDKFISACRKIVSIFSAIFVVIFSFGCPVVSAVNESSPVWESTLPYSGVWDRDTALSLFQASANDLPRKAQIISGTDFVCYPFFVLLDGELKSVCYISDDPNAQGRSIAQGQYSSSYDTLNLGINFYGENNTQPYYFTSFGLQWSSYLINQDVPVFETPQAGIDSFMTRNEVQAPLGSYEIPAGHVAYFRASGNVTFKCQQNVFSINSSTPWPEARQYWGSSNSLPASGTTFPLSGSSLIPWQRGGSPDILGRTKTSVYTAAPGPVYTYVFNQLINYLSSDDPYDYRPNGTIFVEGNISEFRLYSLSMGYDSSGGVSGYLTATSSSLDGYTNPGLGFVDPETGAVYYEHEDGTVYVPSVGGDNYMPESTTSEGFLSQVVGILKELLNSIGNLFGFAYEAIVSLVSLASPFVSKLGALYSWLPSPVFSALTSAMVLAITIGVLKSFL